METKHVNQYLKELITCTMCGYCKEVCPTFEDLGWDSAAARGKIALAYGLYMGDIEPDESVLERLLQCTTCEDCKRRCPSKTEVVKAIEAIRKDLNEAGFAHEVHKKIYGSIKKYGNPYGEERTRAMYQQLADSLTVFVASMIVRPRPGMDSFTSPFLTSSTVWISSPSRVEL